MVHTEGKKPINEQKMQLLLVLAIYLSEKMDELKEIKSNKKEGATFFSPKNICLNPSFIAGKEENPSFMTLYFNGQKKNYIAI